MWFDIFNRMPKPFNEGFLPLDSGHRVHYLQYGNPKGIPVISFHGGPGGSSRPKYAKLFDLKKYHFIQFDQRGCGLSRFRKLTANNDTDHIIADAKRLLDFLDIQTPVIVHGVSWGATMALLFAETMPDKVCKIVVSSVFLAGEYDVNWVKKDSERFYPDLWEQMRKQVRRKDLYAAYYKLLFSEKVGDNLKALSYLGSYEYMLGQLDPKFTEKKMFYNDELQSARVYFHFDKNKYFLTDNQIIRNTDKIRYIPTLIVHNRLDFCCPIKQAWELHKSLPNSKMVIVPGMGHSTPQLLKEFKKQLKEFLS